MICLAWHLMRKPVFSESGKYLAYTFNARADGRGEGAQDTHDRNARELPREAYPLSLDHAAYLQRMGVRRMWTRVSERAKQGKDQTAAQTAEPPGCNRFF